MFAPEDKRPAMLEAFFNTQLPNFLTQIEKHYSNGTYLVGGETPTTADFFIGGVIWCSVLGNPNYFAAQHPGVEQVKQANPLFCAYGEKFAAEIKGWLDQRPNIPI